MPKVVLHVPAEGVQSDLAGWHLALYRFIRDLAARRGIGIEIRPRDRDLKPATREVADGRFNDGNLHVVDDRSVRAEGVLNAAVAYFWGFWHLDPQGTKALSSIGDRAYDTDAMPLSEAEPFIARLRATLVEARRSKYGQKREGTELPPGSVAVFFQGAFPRRQGVTAFDDLDMLNAVRAQTDCPIVVKPHPLATDVFALAEARAACHRDRRVTFTDANVHDILRTCAATVSINSTVALEGFLHEKPAILFGKSDFHHLCGRVTEAGAFAQVLEAELSRRDDLPRYLAWYFLRHCLWLKSTGLEDALWSRFADAGFPLARFGGQ